VKSDDGNIVRFSFALSKLKGQMKILGQTCFPPTPDLKNENFSKSFHFLISIPKSTKSVSETPPIHYGPHDKLVELAEICRLRYSNVKSDDRNMVTFGKRKLKFRKTASSNVEI